MDPTAMSATTILLPGEEVPSDRLPKSKKGTLVLGPGFRHIPPSTVLSTAAGILQADYRKSALWLESSHGRYLPAVNDLVIAQICHSSTDTYHCSLTPHTPFVLLNQLAFEGANKKTRPQLKPGDLVYARVVKSSKWEDTEIECLNSSTCKAEGMGPLNGGMVFQVSPMSARRLMMKVERGKIIILEQLGEKIRFEVAVGRNGRVWVDSASVKETVAIGRLLNQVDNDFLGIEDQKKLVKGVFKELGV